MCKWSALLVLVFIPQLATAAQCKVDGEWYDYNHPKCAVPAQDGSGSNAENKATVAGPRLPSEAKLGAYARTICKTEWTERGTLDNEMYHYCLERQEESIRNLRWFHDKYIDQAFYTEYSYSYCSNEWTKRGILNPQMMNYCLNLELEGVKDVIYYQEQYGGKLVNQIAGRALVTFGSWNMAAYQVRLHFSN